MRSYEDTYHLDSEYINTIKISNQIFQSLPIIDSVQLLRCSTNRRPVPLCIHMYRLSVPINNENSFNELFFSFRRHHFFDVFPPQNIIVIIISETQPNGKGRITHRDDSNAHHTKSRLNGNGPFHQNQT